MMLYQEKEFANNSWRPLSCNNFTNKKNSYCVTKRMCLVALFGIELNLHLPSFKVWGLQMTVNVPIVYTDISSTP